MLYEVITGSQCPGNNHSFLLSARKLAYSPVFKAFKPYLLQRFSGQLRVMQNKLARYVGDARLRRDVHAGRNNFV